MSHKSSFCCLTPHSFIRLWKNIQITPQMSFIIVHYCMCVCVWKEITGFDWKVNGEEAKGGKVMVSYVYTVEEVVKVAILY